MRERTIEKIRAAIKELQQNNKRISVRSVAESASTSKDNARLYIKLYLSSVPDSMSVPDLESVPVLNDVPDLKGVPDSKSMAKLGSIPVLNSVPDSMSVPDLENTVDSKGVPDLKDIGDSNSVPDFMYTTPEERADATMAYLNDFNKKVITRDILEMNEIVDMLFSDF